MPPIELELNHIDKAAWVINPGMSVRTLSHRIGDQRLAVEIHCSPDDSSGYAESRLLHVKAKYKIGPLKIGEERIVEATERADFSKDGEQFMLSLDGKNILTATFRSAKRDL